MCISETHPRLGFSFQYFRGVLLRRDDIDFVNGTGPSCSEAAPQHDAATSILQAGETHANHIKRRHYNRLKPHIRMTHLKGHAVGAAN